MEGREKAIKLSKIPVVLLAGGIGARLRSLFPDIPKVMVRVKGRPFLEWILLFLKDSGFSDFIISCGYLAEKIEAYFKNTVWHNEIRFLKEDMPLGTGGAVIFVSNQISDKDFIVMNADSITLLDFKKFLRFYNKEKPDMLIAVKKTRGLNRYGIVNFDTNNRIIKFNEKKKLTQDVRGAFINTGIYLFSRRIFPWLQNRNDFPVSLEEDIIPHLIEEGDVRIMAFETKGGFIDIGTPESFAMAGDFITKNSNKQSKFFNPKPGS